MLGGGVPYCPWWGGPWGEHGVCPFDEPLRAGGRSRSGYHVVVPALEDCNPDLRRGVVTVCRWGGEVVVWGAEASGAEEGRPREMRKVQLLFRLPRDSTPRSIREWVEFLKLACLHLGLTTVYYRAT